MTYAGQSIVIQEDKILKLVDEYFCWCGNTANVTVINNKENKEEK